MFAVESGRLKPRLGALLRCATKSTYVDWERGARYGAGSGR